MVNTIIMKVLFAIIAISNLVLPFYKDWSWRFSVFQIIAVLIWVYGLMGGLGYFNQATPILAIGILRMLQAGCYLIFRRSQINWIVFAIFIALDVIFTIFLIFDKANYEYVKEEVSNEN
jgi:hypothetical protein